MSRPWTVVYMGTPRCAADTLERLMEGPDPVVGVVTRPDRPAGRGQKTIPSSVRLVAEAHKIPVITPEKIRSDEFLGHLSAWAPDLIVVVAFGRILPRSVLDMAPQGCINVHYSLLPRYRGAAPMTWALVNGDETSGVTTMRLVEQMDAGPILLQEDVPIAPEETSASLEAKLSPIGAKLLLQTIRGLKEGSIKDIPQREEEATYAAMLKKEDGEIDWTQPARVIERLVRAFSPWPSAYTHWRKQLLKVYRASVMNEKSQVPPGEVVRADDQGLWVNTGDRVLNLQEVQLENRKRLPSSEFVRGARIEKGARF
jgi:methionyl-tRNA formyltransferase